MDAPTSETNRVLKCVSQGDRQGLGEVLAAHRPRLKRLVALRLDRRLQARIDPSDVIQETFIEAAGRLDEYARDPRASFYLWLRFLTCQKLVTLERHHLGVKMRAVGREEPLDRPAMPEATSAAMAAHLLGNEPRASEVAIQQEMRARLERGLDQLEEPEREILALRHYEQLSRAEAAQVLGISEAATSKRYVRALKRIKEILGDPFSGALGLGS